MIVVILDGKTLYENEKTLIFILNTKKNMDNISQTNQYGQMDFNLPHDIVPLPSGGKYYKSKKKSVKVGYLTASDENMLSNIVSQSSRENLFTSLVRLKMYEPELKPEEMLFGDIEAIMIFLRNTSFGTEYTVSLTDPSTGKKFTTTVDLGEIKLKNTLNETDENGLFTTVLPKTGHSIKLKLLNAGDELELTKKAESYPVGMVVPRITWRLLKMIVSIDGNTDKEFIASFIEKMPIMDSKHIRRFMNDNEPGLDLKKVILAPSGELVEFEISFGVDFFRPFFGV